jgi:hypothetical protein
MKNINWDSFIFENMSLHTLANAYIDCFKDSALCVARTYEEEILSYEIMRYITKRNDVELFSKLISKYVNIRF